MQKETSPSALDIAVRILCAVTATIAAVRAAQGAMRAWQRLLGSFRSGGQERPEDGNPSGFPRRRE